MNSAGDRDGQDAVRSIPPDGGNQKIERESGEKGRDGADQKEHSDAHRLIAGLAQFYRGEFGAVISAPDNNRCAGLQAIKSGDEG